MLLLVELRSDGLFIVGKFVPPKADKRDLKAKCEMKRMFCSQPLIFTGL